jgi:hypothetical protein
MRRIFFGYLSSIEIRGEIKELRRLEAQFEQV